MHLEDHPALKFFRQVETTYPTLWSAADELRQLVANSRNVPASAWYKEGCIFTRAEAEATAMKIERGDRFAYEPAVLGAMVAWRPTKGIYRFDSTLYAEIVATTLSGEVPSHLLSRLPGYAVFVEAPGVIYAEKEIVGFWAYLSATPNENRIELVMLYDDGDYDYLPVPIGNHPISDLAQLAYTNRFAECEIQYQPSETEFKALTACLSSMLSLLLYLCSEKPDIPDWEQPEPKSKFFGKKRRLLAAKEAKSWDVGIRMGAALRVARDRLHEDSAQDVVGTGITIKPHIRSAHWHSYWVGKKGEQRLSLRWLPPIPVNIDDPASLPVIVHPVER